MRASVTRRSQDWCRNPNMQIETVFAINDNVLNFHEQRSPATALEFLVHSPDRHLFLEQIP